MERPRFLQVTHIHDHEFVGFLDVAYSNDDTVAQFKNRLSMGTPYKVVKLLYHGLLIENARELLDLIPDFRDVGLPRLSVHTETPGGDHVIVKSTIGEFKVYLPLNSTIEQLKEKIEEELQYFCDTLQRPCFLFAGRRLEHKCTLLQCGLVCGSTLRLLFVTNGRGGGAGYRSPTLFVDTENSEALEKWNFSSSGPQWRIADRGLNIEGKCKNKSCAAYGQMVICNKGLTVFNIAQESSCPVCSCYFEATTCAFTNCMWMFEGRKRGPGSDISSKWYMGGNKYELFREGGNIVEWDSLLITTKPSLGSAKPSAKKDCPICFEKLPVDLGKQCHTAACGHTFHVRCVSAWKLKDVKSCPTCRACME